MSGTRSRKLLPSGGRLSAGMFERGVGRVRTPGCHFVPVGVTSATALVPRRAKGRGTRSGTALTNETRSSSPPCAACATSPAPRSKPAPPSFDLPGSSLDSRKTENEPLRKAAVTLVALHRQSGDLGNVPEILVSRNWGVVAGHRDSSGQEVPLDLIRPSRASSTQSNAASSA